MRIIYSIALLLVGAAIASSQVKIGHVNYGNLLESLPEVKQADEVLKSYQDSIGIALEAQMKMHRDNIAANQKKFQAGEMTKKEAEATNKTLNEEQQRLQREQQLAEASILKRRQNMLQPIIKDVNEAIASYGKENGYKFILDESSGFLLYDSPSDDLTEEIKNLVIK